MNPPAELQAAVRTRAANRCEYCRLHQRLQGPTFHIEHIVPMVKGGNDRLTNLALACPSCNLHKADRVKAIDPISGNEAALFHPVKQSWPDHFRLEGYRIVGLTPSGRATVMALDFNHERRQRIRAVERRMGLEP